ncbi:hypothetical protein PAP18089_04273 [Pandoraea apista]|uniref:Uncharacterized protein n=1 Tax=Pandoraea apista TaxID=93218 RepID=A0A5E5PAD9_9BURK|nr:hypothetical protein PAP18089_04273 [Pandoraea apista]
MLVLKRTVDLTPRVASIPTPSMTYVPLGQFGQGERKLSGGEQHRALASSDRQTAEKSDGDRPAAAHASPQCGGDELWLWRFLLAGRPFGATGAMTARPGSRGRSMRLRGGCRAPRCAIASCRSASHYAGFSAAGSIALLRRRLSRHLRPGCRRSRATDRTVRFGSIWRTRDCGCSLPWGRGRSP